MRRALFQNVDNKTVIAMGNEALARGFVEAGVQFAAAYPGTPTSEILGTLGIFAKRLPIYVEWSANEAQALEAAIGASLAGRDSVFVAKHVGWNVAADALMTSSYMGTRGGLVLVTGDDPGMHSSQNEQDSRIYAKFANIPMLEPSSVVEAKNIALKSFSLSKKFKLPIGIRMVTRLAHSREIINLGLFPKYEESVAVFERAPMELVHVPAVARRNHVRLLQKMEEAKKYFDSPEFVDHSGPESGKVGIITAGMSFQYVKEALDLMGVNIPVLKLEVIHPLPEKQILTFAENVDALIVVEELEPFLEEQIRALLQFNGSTIKLYGKYDNYFPRYGEFSTRLVYSTLAEILKISKNPFQSLSKVKKIVESLKVNRPPVMCPGCPHRATYYALKKALRGKNPIYSNDIGCYALGLLPPLLTADTLLAMGASIGIGHGLAQANVNGTVVAIIGDSTFFHSGLSALANAVYNQSDLLVVVVDNETTAMTGMQGHPGTGITLLEQEGKRLSIEAIARAMGVEHVVVVDPYESKHLIKIIRDLVNKKGPKVLVSRHKCALLEQRQLKAEERLEHQPYVILEDRCLECGACINQFGCPAIQLKTDENGEEKFMIDPLLCTGCGVCAQVCPHSAIVPLEAQSTYSQSTAQP